MKNDQRSAKALKATWVGFWVNLALTVVKFIAGILGSSSAMIADAVHSFSDIATDIAVVFGLRAASKPQDSDHDFGHGKFETLTTAFIGIFLLAVAGGMIFNSGKDILDFINGEVLKTPGWIAAIAAAVSIIMKEGIFHYTMKVARETDSDALRANAWHHRTDSLSSIAVMIGIVAAILLGGKWSVLDPLAAIAVSFLIMFIAFKLLKGSILELSEASLDDGTEKTILETIVKVDGARHPHNLRTRKIGSSIAIDVHVKAPGDLSLTEAHEIAENVERALESKYGKETYIHVHMDPCDQ